MEFPKGAAVTLVPAPYRTFLSQLPADCVDAHTRQVCAIGATTVFRPFTPAHTL
jgi:hypothetical protein